MIAIVSQVRKIIWIKVRDVQRLVIVLVWVDGAKAYMMRSAVITMCKLAS
jgi:hypothetical protein